MENRQVKRRDFLLAGTGIGAGLTAVNMGFADYSQGGEENTAVHGSWT
jgi:hypothetical protein